MSANSSNKQLHTHHVQHKSDAARHVLKKVAPGQQDHKKQLNWRLLTALPLWVALSFTVANVIVFYGAMYYMTAYPHAVKIDSAVFQTILTTLIDLLTLAIAIGVPYVVRQRTTDLRTLGLMRLPTWTDIGLSPLAFVVYALAWSFFSYFATQLIPHFPIDQAQDVGFKALGHQYEYTLAFLTLVVIAPLAEEILFRGYLYGKLLRSVSIIPAILATSLLFGAAHLLSNSGPLQWNVALDTFILSTIMCILRTLTGTIWAGVLLHIIKNAIAFYILFAGPLLMGF